ncbi:MAG TPA: hypothetical protein VN247_03080, partial [Arenimonas sp.]|nr:hypothetical protein [Arenimonas sp.]
YPCEAFKMRIAHSFIIMLTMFIAWTQPLLAQNTPAPACASIEYHQFDFWIGEWEVDGGQDGKTPVGKSTITRVAKGCALHENWRSAGGGDGQSLNVFDRTAKQWTQFWIGADGVILRLEGGLQENTMVLEGLLKMPNDKVQLQRITWAKIDDGRVSQRWETSDDAGKSWQISFIGYYRRK